MDKIFSRSKMVLSLLGAADAIYMLVLKFSHNEGMCLGSGDCITVNTSRYSEIYGVPVAAIGLLGFLAILAVLLLETRPGFFQKNGNLLVFGMGLAGVLYSAYLTYLEIYVIRAICPFCVFAAVVMTLIFILSTIRLVRSL